jgi:hypothetical protein
MVWYGILGTLFSLLFGVVYIPDLLDDIFYYFCFRKMNLQDLTNQENCVESPSEPVIDEEQQQEQEIENDKPRCKYISTKGKNVGKICGSILASESYYEIGLCKKHQTIVSMREKSARKAKKESKDKGIVVQSPALKVKQESNKPIQIITKEQINNEPIEQIDGVETIDLPTINIKLPQVNSDDEINVANNYQEPIIKNQLSIYHKLEIETH